MTLFWRFLAIACALALADGRRLLLGNDGFARVDSPSNSKVTGITVSSWVNITQFPGGVAPIVTMISEDANYQIAFFLREDGAGVLWGGPATETESKPQRHHVDRQPRVLGRRKRSAVDYSMGLGDVMNIMGPRKERSNTWTPMNFVDVSEMGVADLETSGSSHQNHYENWYDVGYELQMQESADARPKIITKPSGNNDFVVINWNNPGGPPLSSNQWDPVGDLAVPEEAPAARPTQVRAPDNERFVWSQEENKDGSWTTQVKPINTGSQTRNSLPPDFILPATTTSRPKPVTKATKSRTFIPDLTRLANKEGSKSRPGLFRYASRRPPRPTTTPAPTTTTTTTTTTRRPSSVASALESRVPLWERLKKTSGEDKSPNTDIFAPIAPKTTTSTTTTTTTTPRPTQSRANIPRVRTTLRPKVYKASGSSQPRVTVRPPLPSKRTTKVPKVNKQSAQRIPHKQISKQKAQQQRINSSKERKYNQNKKLNGFTPAKSYKPTLSHNLDEFRRILEGKPAVEETENKMVVYSVPITDVDHFNRMYDRYQEAESKQSPRINLHVVYERAREGSHAFQNIEEESNQNQIEIMSEPLPVLTYKEEPLHFTEVEPDIAEVELMHPGREQLLRKPVLAEPIDFVPKFDDTSFKPLRHDNPYRSYERDFTGYFPNVQRAEPVLVSEYNDNVGDPTNEDYSVDVPLLSVAAAALSNLQNPLIYQPAVIAEQDISGQQAGFYQEPSRISHEQLPPEYMEKATKDSPVERNPLPPTGQHIRRSYNTNPGYNLPQPIHKVQKSPIKAEVPEVSQPVRQPVVPVTEEASPEIEKETPLNVNFRKMPYNFDANTWYHITFTWSSDDHIMRIFINGELAGLLEATIPDKDVLPTTGVMLLGKTLLPSLTGFDPTSHLTGEMSNFVVWSEALTPLEVQNAFKCEAAPERPVMLTWSATPLRVYNDAVVKKAPPICGISS